MSKFYFEIPVPILEAVAKLPSRSSVVGEFYEHGRVRVVWECDDVRTLYTFPVEWDGTGEPPDCQPISAVTPPRPPRQTGQGSGAASPPKPKGPKVAAVSKLLRRAK